MNEDSAIDCKNEYPRSNSISVELANQIMEREKEKGIYCWYRDADDYLYQGDNAYELAFEYDDLDLDRPISIEFVIGEKLTIDVQHELESLYDDYETFSGISFDQTLVKAAQDAVDAAARSCCSWGEGAVYNVEIDPIGLFNHERSKKPLLVPVKHNPSQENVDMDDPLPFAEWISDWNKSRTAKPKPFTVNLDSAGPTIFETEESQRPLFRAQFSFIIMLETFLAPPAEMPEEEAIHRAKENTQASWDRGDFEH